ncbi:SurA N-terminal domain-containing protein [Arthrobacter sp. JZ12]|uniref:SurA N-terminal domain-containing protein n=1 Tax=Arthrobacter sp. JZ12 TaxID=2654190 RepID=UPI002B47D249|nr:SurA N-terminal domain-containing protein [Arthrobacter sp. JZ12]
MNKKWLLTAALAASLAFATGCATDNQDGSGGAEASSSASAAAEAPTPDLEGIPDVVAVVNGQEIAKDEFVTSYEATFSQMSMQAQVTGQEVDQEQLKTQTLDNLIGNKLLLQEADKRGIEAGEEAIAAAKDQLIQANQFSTEEELFAALEERGIPKEEADEQIRQQVRLDALLAEEGADEAPAEEQLKAAYEQAKTQGGSAEGAEVPTYEEMKPQLEQQAKQQKKSEVAVALVEKLREAGDVESKL